MWILNPPSLNTVPITATETIESQHEIAISAIAIIIWVWHLRPLDFKVVRQMEIFKRILKFLALLNPIRAIAHGIFSLRNRLRKRAKIDYITLNLPSEMP